jgi:segregation and condensation protein B
MEARTEPDTREPIAELEAVIFSARGPATPGQIRRALPELTGAQIGSLVGQINETLRKEGRPYEIAEVAGGYQFRTHARYAEVIRAAQPDRKIRLSRAALETLALVAYRQPLTRVEVEEIRTVDCGAILRSLLERNLVRIVGRRDAPGRPALYGTTALFLEIFGLRSLLELPPLSELRERALGPIAEEETEPAAEPEMTGAPDDAAEDPDLGLEEPEAALDDSSAEDWEAEPDEPR